MVIRRCGALRRGAGAVDLKALSLYAIIIVLRGLGGGATGIAWEQLVLVR